MNSTMSSAKVTDVFRQSRSQAPATRGGKQAGAPKAAAAAAAPAQAAAAAAPSSAQQDEADEAALRQFDLDSRFGPCTGITRLERWERAAGLGLNPPPEVPQLVQRHGADTQFNINCFHHPY